MQAPQPSRPTSANRALLRARASSSKRQPQRAHCRAAYRPGDGTGLWALSVSATTARATTTADGRPGATTLTMQMISPAVCALTTLAFLLDAAWLAAATNAAGWRGRLPSTVTSYLLGGSFMPGTVSVAYDISGRI